MYPKYSQRDKRWADYRFSEARLTIHDYGCALTDISAIGTWMGVPMRPDELAKKCKFTSDGKLYWNSIPGPLQFKHRYYSLDMKLAYHTLKNTKWDVCLFEVQWGRQRHWVTLVGWDKRGPIVHDPWDGVFIPLNKTQFPNVTGMAIITKR